MSSNTFKLTDKHIKLLRNAYVGWEYTETGAPAIDGKRPYGNSDVPGDIIRILFGEIPEEAQESLYDYAMQLHKETKTALQIILCTGQFVPGLYEKESYKDRSWKLKEQ